MQLLVRSRSNFLVCRAMRSSRGAAQLVFFDAPEFEGSSNARKKVEMR
jgi:hypothetical protein